MRESTSVKRRTLRPKRQDARKSARMRFMLIVGFFVLWIGGIGTRLVHLQVTQHDELRQKAVGQRRNVKKTKLLRGTIYDRNERALAISVNVKTLYADATEIKDAAAAAKDLARVLKVSEKSLLNQLTEAKSLDRKYVPIAKGLEEPTVQEINKALENSELRKSDLPRYAGLHWREDQKRSYPHNSLAAHVIGFSNNDGVGQAGIEQSRNEMLHGAVIRRQQERDRLGRVYDEVVSEKEPAKDILLTLDNSIQYFAEQALEKAVKNAGAKAGMAIVISNKTGEILAMANYPTFDPNKLETITSDNLRNGAIQNMYSPGSVFKLVTYGSALEKKLISPDGEIDTGNGVIEVAKRKFHDHGAMGRISYLKAMATSSNVAAIRTGMRVGRDDFHSSIIDFGFGSRTGVELPAETPGVVRPKDKWFGDSLASMSIGYEIGVSALQMATAFATIANDGIRIQPHLIKEIRQSDETIISVTQPEQTQVVSVDTARGLRKMLRQVVLTGTGKKANVAGYSIAGKTGTAWKFDEKLKRVNSAKYISSFIGFAPADDPNVTIAVVIDEPKVGGRDGGSVAAPVFRDIAEKILPELKISGGNNNELIADNNEEVVEPVGNGDLENTDEAIVKTENSGIFKQPEATVPKIPVEKKSGRSVSAEQNPKSKPDEKRPPEKERIIDKKTAVTPPERKRKVEITNRN